MQLQAERSGITLSNEIPGDLPLVSADSKRIQQVLVNLIHNAIKFTNPGGKITVSADSPKINPFYLRLLTLVLGFHRMI